MVLTDTQKRILKEMKETKVKQVTFRLIQVEASEVGFCALGFMLYQSGMTESQLINLMSANPENTVVSLARTQIGLRRRGYFAILELNDVHGKSFKEIADDIETYPNYFFGKHWKGEAVEAWMLDWLLNGTQGV